MAKRKNSQIQKRNIQPKVTSVFDSSRLTPAEEQLQKENENTFLFTIVGMFSGMVIGLTLNQMTLGFIIGIAIGAVIDFIINRQKQKKLMAKQDNVMKK